MIAWVVVGVLLFVSLGCNALIVKRALTLDNTLSTGVESIEECLDKINSSYEVVGKILQSPLAANDPKIKQIHNELKRVHDSLLVVADRLVSSWNKNAQGTTSDQG